MVAPCRIRSRLGGTHLYGDWHTRGPMPKLHALREAVIARMPSLSPCISLVCEGETAAVCCEAHVL
jgi:hypothetical protein